MFSIAHPFLVVVVSEAGVLELLHELVLLLLPPGELGQELPHGGDGESVGLGHDDSHQQRTNFMLTTWSCSTHWVQKDWSVDMCSPWTININDQSLLSSS